MKYLHSYLMREDEQLELQLERIFSSGEMKDMPFYFKCMNLCLDPTMRSKLQAAGYQLLKFFLDTNKHVNPLYQLIYTHILEDELIARGEFLNPSEF